MHVFYYDEAYLYFCKSNFVHNTRFVNYILFHNVPWNGEYFLWVMKYGGWVTLEESNESLGTPGLVVPKK